MCNPPESSLTASWKLEWADSQVGRAEHVGADLRIVLSAAHVRGAQGGATEGYLSSPVLWFRGARWSGELAHVLGRLAAGELRFGGQTLRVLPLPFEAVGPLQCHLALANGTVLEITAASVDCPLDGRETFVESYAC